MVRMRHKWLECPLPWKGEDLLQELATTNSITSNGLKVVFLSPHLESKNAKPSLVTSEPPILTPSSPTKLCRSHRMIPNDQTSEGRPIFTAPCLTASRRGMVALRILEEWPSNPSPANVVNQFMTPQFPWPASFSTWLDMSPLASYSRYPLFYTSQNATPNKYDSIFGTNQVKRNSAKPIIKTWKIQDLSIRMFPKIEGKPPQNGWFMRLHEKACIVQEAME